MTQVASLARDICGFYIVPMVAVFGSNTDTSMLMDVGVGGTGDAVDQIKINNIPWGGAVGFGHISFFPLHVRAGERLAFRIQAKVVSDAFQARIFLCYADRMPGWGGYTEADTYTADTATSAPATGDLADNAWDEAVASTTNPIRALTLHLCMTPGTTMTAATPIVDVGVGAGGSEVALGSWFTTTGASESCAPMGPDFIEVEIPAGSRLAIRKNETANLSGLLIGWR